MRIHGTLSRWNDDRGFGFIAPAKGPPDIFVHISEFPREGGPPRINELISFEVVPGADGKQRAVRVMRPRQTAQPGASPARDRERSSLVSRAIAFVIVGALIAYGYSRFAQRTAPAAPATEADSASLAASPSPYSCDGRTHCSQMQSCEEATYFIRNCPNTEMDGNNDGVPCERQWCN